MSARAIISVTIDPGCILCAWCVSICPEVFEFPPYRQNASIADRSARLTPSAPSFFASHASAIERSAAGCAPDVIRIVYADAPAP